MKGDGVQESFEEDEVLSPLLGPKGHVQAEGHKVPLRRSGEVEILGPFVRLPRQVAGVEGPDMAPAVPPRPHEPAFPASVLEKTGGI